MIHVFICHDNIAEPLANAISMNMMDHTVEELISNSHRQGVQKITVGSSMDDLLEAAKQSWCSWGLFIRSGNYLEYRFLDNMFKSLFLEDQNTALIGHILDRNDRYYEVHDQIFLVNLRMLRATGDDVSYTPTYRSRPVIERSTENYHHNHTPIWVKRGDGWLDVVEPAPGADLVGWAIANGHVRPFTSLERKSRYYTYPEWSFSDNVGKVEKTITAINSRFYLFNTDGDIREYFKDDIGTISRLVVPASGFLPFEMARDLDTTDDFKFVLFDTSNNAIWLYRYMMEHWTGEDPHDILDKAPDNCVAVHREDVPDKWTAMMDRFGGHSEWLSFFNHYKKRYTIHQLDIMGSYHHEHFVNQYQNKQHETLYSISNIYWYAPTSMLRSHAERATGLQEHLSFLKRTAPDARVFYSMVDHNYAGVIRNAPKEVPMNFPWRTGINIIDKPVDLY